MKTMPQKQSTAFHMSCDSGQTADDKVGKCRSSIITNL